jgi:hypothetical protein
MRRTCPHGGSFRLGPDCFAWGDDYTRALPFEIDPDQVDLAVIGGLTDPPLSRDEYRWLEAVLIENGLRAAMDRVVRGPDGKPLRDADGSPIMRRVLMPMPNRKPQGAG